MRGSLEDMFAPCDDARQKIRQIARAIVSGEADPLLAAIHLPGGLGVRCMGCDSSCEELADPGATFLQLADVLEESQDQPDVKVVGKRWSAKAAAAYLAGKPWPDWKRIADSPYPVRQDSPS